MSGGNESPAAASTGLLNAVPSADGLGCFRKSLRLPAKAQRSGQQRFNDKLPPDALPYLHIAAYLDEIDVFRPRVFDQSICHLDHHASP